MTKQSITDSTEIMVSVTRPMVSKPGSSTINLYGVDGGRTIADPPGKSVFSFALTLFQAEDMARKLEEACAMVREEEDSEDEQAKNL